MNDIERELIGLSAVEAAARLIGCDLIRYLGTSQLVGRIVEAEAYDQTDTASHSYRGETKRNGSMFRAAGRAYVYFTYGMHYCMNIVVGQEGYGSAVLIRALEPIAGIDVMSANRQPKDIKNLCNGPAKLCQALAIDMELNGHDLSKSPLKLRLNQPLSTNQIDWSQRIGIREISGQELSWRACLKGSTYLSKITQ